MSLWQFSQCILGWNRAHGGDEARSLSPGEYDDMLSRNASAIVAMAQPRLGKPS